MRPTDIADWLGGQINDTFRAFAQGTVDAANWMMHTAIDQLNSGLRINLAAEYVQQMLSTMRYLVLPVVAVLFVFQVIRAIVAGQPRMLVTAVTGSAIGLCGGAACAALAAGLLAIVDEFTSFVLGDAEERAEQAMTTVFAMDGAIDTIGWLVVIVVAGLAIIAFVAIMVVMVLRKAMIIATVVFGPFAFAGASTDRTKAWAWRWVELLVGLALTKFVIAVIITLGFSALSDWRTGTSSDVIVGVCWVGLAAFAPIGVMRFVSFAGHEIADAHAMTHGPGLGQAGHVVSTRARSAGRSLSRGAGASLPATMLAASARTATPRGPAEASGAPAAASPAAASRGRHVAEPVRPAPPNAPATPPSPAAAAGTSPPAPATRRHGPPTTGESAA